MFSGQAATDSGHYTRTLLAHFALPFLTSRVRAGGGYHVRDRILPARSERLHVR